MSVNKQIDDRAIKCVVFMLKRLAECQCDDRTNQ